ncbi:MAG: porin [Brumimicrobium sp.]
MNQNKLVFSLTLISSILLFEIKSYGQSESNNIIDSNSYISGYIDSYYGYDFQNPDNSDRPDFLYNYHRHNELNINLALLKYNYKNDRIRGNLGVMFGSYVTRNLSEEPAALKNIYEANIGIKLAKEHSLWLDVGIMESNLGFESVIGANNWIMTRSMLAENSPYYLNAAKLSYTTKSKKFKAKLLFSNGWQKMTNGHPSMGHQIQWLPTKNWTINSSSFFGVVDLDIVPGVNNTVEWRRYFHNFYVKYDNEKFGLIAGLDVGFDQSVEDSKNIGGWLGGILVAHYKLTNKFSLAARGEYFFDPNYKLTSPTPFPEFNNIGTSINFDYQIHSHLLWRIEGRVFSSMHPIYRYNDEPTTSNYYLGTSLSLRLGEL